MYCAYGFNDRLFKKKSLLHCISFIGHFDIPGYDEDVYISEVFLREGQTQWRLAFSVWENSVRADRR